MAILVITCMYCDDDGITSGGTNGGTEPNNNPIDSWPVWSPADTATIAYTHHAQTWDEVLAFGPHSVWVLDLQTGHRKLVAQGTGQDWSPDGEEIALVRDGSIFSVGVRSGEERQILACSTPCTVPRFSPIAREMSYFMQFTSGFGTWILDLESSEKTRISERVALDWTQDGGELVCDSLVVMTPAGDRVGKIPHSPERGYVSQARWSPDGSAVAFGANSGIWTVNRDGTDEREIADHGFTPCWSPDGAKIACSSVSMDGTGRVIWIMNADGTGKQQVTFPGSYVDGT